MPDTVFFSWQSDVAQNRTFIRSALDRALEELAGARSVDEPSRELVADQDTQGVPGSPSIADAILAKIGSSFAFVADLSFVAERASGGKVPNPNVMLEYGYALRALGDAHVIAVFNEAYGKPEDLPFDLAHRRWPIRFHLEASQVDRSEQKSRLVKSLKLAIASIITLEAQRDQSPEPPIDATGLARRYCRDDSLSLEWTELLQSAVGTIRDFIDTDWPSTPPDGPTFNALLEAIAAHSEDLRRMMLICGRWGTANAISEAVAAIRDLSYRGDVRSGYSLWTSMRELPAVICFYWLVAGSIARDDLTVTKGILTSTISNGRSRAPLVTALNFALDDINWKAMKGLERHYYPQSVYAGEMMKLDARFIALNEQRATQLYADTEHLISLEFAYQRLREAERTGIWFWAPGGDFLWDTSPRRFAGLSEEGYSPLIEAGLLGGSEASASAALQAYREHLKGHSGFLRLAI